LERNTAKPRFTVLIDTNILVSGLVFSRGNEHRILKLAEEGTITLVLPEFVLQEAREVLNRRFPGHAAFLDVFLARAEHTMVPWKRIEPDISQHQGAVRDAKDAAVVTAAILTKPNFAVTGDKTLREDMRRLRELSRFTTTCSSGEFLSEISEKS
jgi:putative PIN family toxin of toxin-antitoxin system